MEQKKKSGLQWLCIAIAMMLIGLAGASIIQSQGGRVKIKEVEFCTSAGTNIKGKVFIPKNATIDNPAPCIVLCHGMYADSGILDQNFVEFSRRGYVVLSYDAPSHGESENGESIGNVISAGYDAVAFAAGLPYVDSSHIGITGHSVGGATTSAAVQTDIAQGTNYIESALINSTSPALDENAYGNVSVAVVAGKIDEFGFETVDENGNKVSRKKYITTKDAQFFLHDNMEYAQDDIRSANQIYTDIINGKEVKRAVYTPYSWHTLTEFNPWAVAHVLDWFEETIGAPNPISSSNQIWLIKMVFNLVGLIGFGIFLYAFPVTMLFTPVFSQLRSGEVIAPKESLPGDKKWFWILLIICPIFGSGIYFPLLTHMKSRTFAREMWGQADSWAIGVWTMLVAIFSLAIMFLIYFVQWRKQGVSLKERGLVQSWSNWGKTLLLSLLTIFAAYIFVYLGQFFFHTDFRFYEVIRIVPFKAWKLKEILWPYLPLFLIGYIASSIANNCFNYKVAGKNGKGQWKNLALCAVMSALPALLIYVPNYVYLFITGENLFMGESTLEPMLVSWLISTLVVMPVSTVIGRKLYQISNNPYIGGVICGIMMTMIKCMSTLTWA